MKFIAVKQIEINNIYTVNVVDTRVDAEELELLISQNNDYQLIVEMFKGNKEDVEFGFLKKTAV